MSPKASKLPDSIEGALRRRKAPPEFVACFARSVDEAKRGPGHIRESEIEPVTGIAPLPEERLASARDLARTVAITLNGGLGTTMGMRGPKSLLTASGSLTFLEVALRQAEMVGVRPLLMNSFATDRAVQEALASREGDHGPVASFLQHEAPKLRAADFEPVSIPGRPELEWCPPGHGAVFTALLSSGWLERLLAEAGHELVPVKDAHLCCGSAGSSSVLQPKLAERLRQDKLANLMAGSPDVIATANVGCQMHLASAAGCPVAHWVELL